MDRRDLLSECMRDSHGLPMPEFMETWCAACLQPDCSRSRYGSSRFEVRAATWEDRLFNRVPRMDPADPLYKDIAKQNFQLVEAGPPPEIGTWSPPRHVPGQPVQQHTEQPGVVVPQGAKIRLGGDPDGTK